MGVNSWGVPPQSETIAILQRMYAVARDTPSTICLDGERHTSNSARGDRVRMRATCDICALPGEEYDESGR